MMRIFAFIALTIVAAFTGVISEPISPASIAEHIPKLGLPVNFGLFLPHALNSIESIEPRSADNKTALSSSPETSHRSWPWNDFFSRFTSKSDAKALEGPTFEGFFEFLGLSAGKFLATLEDVGYSIPTAFEAIASSIRPEDLNGLASSASQLISSISSIPMPQTKQVGGPAGGPSNLFAESPYDPPAKFSSDKLGEEIPPTRKPPTAEITRIKPQNTDEDTSTATQHSAALSVAADAGIMDATAPATIGPMKAYGLPSSSPLPSPGAQSQSLLNRIPPELLPNIPTLPPLIPTTADNAGKRPSAAFEALVSALERDDSPGKHEWLVVASPDAVTPQVVPPEFSEHSSAAWRRATSTAVTSQGAALLFRHPLPLTQSEVWRALSLWSVGLANSYGLVPTRDESEDFGFFVYGLLERRWPQTSATFAGAALDVLSYVNATMSLHAPPMEAAYRYEDLARMLYLRKSDSPEAFAKVILDYFRLASLRFAAVNAHLVRTSLPPEAPEQRRRYQLNRKKDRSVAFENDHNRIPISGAPVPTVADVGELVTSALAAVTGPLKQPEGWSTNEFADERHDDDRRGQPWLLPIASGQTADDEIEFASDVLFGDLSPKSLSAHFPQSQNLDSSDDKLLVEKERFVEMDIMPTTGTTESSTSTTTPKLKRRKKTKPRSVSAVFTADGTPAALTVSPLRRLAASLGPIRRAVEFTGADNNNNSDSAAAPTSGAAYPAAWPVELGVDHRRNLYVIPALSEADAKSIVDMYRRDVDDAETFHLFFPFIDDTSSSTIASIDDLRVTPRIIRNLSPKKPTSLSRTPAVASAKAQQPGSSPRSSSPVKKPSTAAVMRSLRQPPKPAHSGFRGSNSAAASATATSQESLRRGGARGTMKTTKQQHSKGEAQRREKTTTSRTRKPAVAEKAVHPKKK